MHLKILFCSFALALSAEARPWSDDVIYFAMTDRYFANSTPVGCDPALRDAKQDDIARYQGGDFRGVENALQAGYFNDLGITVQRNRLAQGLLMTLTGIPCLYYGTEFVLIDDGGKIGEDGETGRMMFNRQRGGPTMQDVKSSADGENFAVIVINASALVVYEGVAAQ